MKLRPVGLIVVFALLGAPPVAYAQQAGKVYRIGVLDSGRPPSPGNWRLLLFVKLKELGWVEGQNVEYVGRFTEGNLQRLPAAAAELVSLGVDVIVTFGGTPPTLAAKQATQTIPIVFTSAGDPVERGLVASLARRGGNVTGIANFVTYGKLLELLKEAVPKISRVAFLHSPAVFASPENVKTYLATVEAEARTLNLKVQPVPLQTPEEIERVFQDFGRNSPEGLLVDDVQATVLAREQLCRRAIQEKLPAIGQSRVFPEAGCLLSYGEPPAERFRQVAVLVDKVLRGAKPADLPVERMTTLEMVINLKTAKALGLKIPQSVLVRADEVIQ